MKFIKLWFFGASVSIIVVVAAYIVAIQRCQGAGCAQAEFIFFTLPIYWFHTTLAIVAFKALKKHSTLGTVARIFGSAFLVSLPLNLFALYALLSSPQNSTSEMLAGMLLLFAVCLSQSIACWFYYQKATAA